MHQVSKDIFLASTTYFFKNLVKLPLGDLRLGISLKDEDFLALRTHSDLRTVSIPRKRCDPRQDPILVFLSLLLHLYFN